jgi:hypothetical protein
MERVCNLTETTIAAPGGTLVIDGRVNGGITVYGSNRRDILVHAKISASARTRERAEALADQRRRRLGPSRARCRVHRR